MKTSKKQLSMKTSNVMKRLPLLEELQKTNEGLY
jgi:hypothetical protein